MKSSRLPSSEVDALASLLPSIADLVKKEVQLRPASLRALLESVDLPAGANLEAELVRWVKTLTSLKDDPSSDQRALTIHVLFNRGLSEAQVQLAVAHIADQASTPRNLKVSPGILYLQLAKDGTASGLLTVTGGPGSIESRVPELTVTPRQFGTGKTSITVHIAGAQGDAFYNQLLVYADNESQEVTVLAEKGQSSVESHPITTGVQTLPPHAAKPFPTVKRQDSPLYLHTPEKLFRHTPIQQTSDSTGVTALWWLLAVILFIMMAVAGSQSSRKSNTTPQATVQSQIIAPTLARTSEVTPTVALLHNFSARLLYNVNLRSNPSQNASVLGVYKLGSEVAILGKNEDSTWVMVRTQDAEGWMYRELLTFDEDLKNIPVFLESAK
ncbi:SH3 domain-containing protein [Chloroflexales bacterium ZM16-3]|nr:SH3 domain-containing protein [Chloroflexales bacterium ZM16-3]